MNQKGKLFPKFFYEIIRLYRFILIKIHQIFIITDFPMGIGASCKPVILTFACSTIWPLFHYLPADVDINEEQWEGYKRANQIFADYIAEIAEEGDVIWVHDYHLMLLPEMLRLHTESAGKNVKIGFFLHIPFPTSEVYR